MTLCSVVLYMHHGPKDNSQHSHYHENLESYILKIFFVQDLCSGGIRFKLGYVMAILRFFLVFPVQMLSRRRRWMGHVACTSMCERDEQYIQNFSPETGKEEDSWET